MENVLLKETNGKKFYWTVVDRKRTAIKIIKGELGQKYKIEKIKSDTLISIDTKLEERIDQLIKEGYQECEYLPYDKVLVENKWKWTYNTIPRKVEILISNLNDEINEFLYERGLTYMDSFVEINDENILMRLITLETVMTEELISTHFEAKIDSLRKSIEDQTK